jgi:EmrB/QacA subfamily drug resistance transporter
MSPSSRLDVRTAADTLVHRWRWPALFAVLLAHVMDLFDGAVTAVAAPTIRADLHADYAQVQWFSAAYVLTFAVGLITGARLGDIHGRRRVLLAGALGFTLSSLLCGLAWSGGALIAFRAVQGLFAAAMIPQQFGIIKTMFRPAEMPKAFGALGPVIGLATVAAPVLGGVLVDADLLGTGWRMVFLINLLVAGILLFVPEAKSPVPVRLDPVGTVLVTVSAVLLLYPLVQGREADWPLWTFGALAAAVPMLGIFGWYEVRKQRRDGSALVMPGLFRRRSFTAGLLVGLGFYAALQALMLTLVLYLQLAAGFSALRAGLTLAPWSVGAALSSTVSGLVLTRRFGRRVLHAGLLVMALGVAGLAGTLSITGTAVSSWHLVPSLGVAGLGMGLLLAPFLNIVLWGVNADQVGAASGVLNANQQLAGAIGVAVLGTVFFAVAGTSGFTAAIRLVLWIVTAVLVACFALVFLLPTDQTAAARTASS